MAEQAGMAYRRSSRMMSRRVAGEMVLVPIAARTVDADTRAAELFVLNATAERLWEMLASPPTEPELARNLIVEFEVDPVRPREDTSPFVRALLEIGALEVVPRGS
jgi:hypothetical protein